MKIIFSISFGLNILLMHKFKNTSEKLVIAITESGKDLIT